MGRSKKLRRLEVQQEQRIQAQFVASQISYWSGPTPSPEVLHQYDKIVPGSADRIIAMAERQSTHRQELELIAVRGGDRRAFMGSIFGFVIGMTAIIGGIYLAMRGQEIGGYSLMIVTITSLAAVFVVGRRSARRELVRKAPPPPDRADS